MPLLLKQALIAWFADNAMRMSAALAYYAIFSLAPLLVIVISIVSLVYGGEAARGQIADQISELVGEQAGQTIQAAIAATGQVKPNGIFAALVAFGIMLFGASTVFGELKNALNDVWGVAAKPGQAVFTLARDRLLSFMLVFCIGFLLLVSLVISSVLAGLSSYMANALPLAPVLWKILDFLVSFSITSALFAMIFKILPNVILRWRDVLPGAALTALLFTVGKSLLAWYLGTNSVASSFRAAGSVIIILLWVYYAACILFLGAEFTKAWVIKTAHHIIPHRHAALLNHHLKS